MSRSPRGDPKPRVPGVLSRRPATAWPDGILHHGFRFLLLLFAGGLITVLFPPADRPRMARYEVGSVADETILARIPFAVPKTAEELERETQEARASIPPTFNYRPEAVDTMVSRLEAFFAQIDSIGESGETGGVVRYLAERSIRPTRLQLDILLDAESRGVLRTTAVRAARQVLPRGVADNAELDGLTTTILVVREPDGRERTAERADVLSPREFLEQAVELLPAAALPELQQLLRLILIQHQEHSFELNIAATELDRDAAARAVPTMKQDVKVDEAIVRANTQVSARDAEVLDAYTAALANAGLLEEGGMDVTPFFGAGLLNVLLLAVFGLLLFFFRNEIYSNVRWMLLMAALVAAYFGVAAVVARNALPTELLPIAFVALAVAVLWDGRMALVLVTVLAVLTGVQSPFSGMGVVAVTLVGGAAAALSVRAVRRRSQTWVFIALITAAYALVLLALGMVHERDPGSLLVGLGAATGNATLSAILAMGFIPVFELFTGITTDQTLLEWADPNRPLLKRLSMEAPGTYAHTINVANLAEAAANAIGASGLLCRVGLYYHDVGKMLRPQYFVENQPEGRNPHDRLKPETSAAIVKEHVVEGLKLAQDAKVPDVVAAFIPEHHGTQRISFFWEKAKEEYGEEGLDIEDFTYPGPRPQSRETAIAMLADAVESATRALQDPTPERVRDLIENLVDSRMVEGQLDEAPITLRDIRQIKEQFIKVLSGIYHHRIDYPQTKHLTEAPEPPPTPAPTDPEPEPPPADGRKPHDARGSEPQDREEERPEEEEDEPAPASAPRGRGGGGGRSPPGAGGS